MKLVNITILITALLYLQSGHGAVTQVQATVDKNPVTLEESFRLEVTANDNVSSDALDTAALLKDFVVGRTSVSRNTTMVNFKTSQSTVWTTTLIPREAGQFTIPALNVAGQMTQPINISVMPVSANKNVNSDLFITTEVDLEEAYIQQQIRYTVKLHLALELQRGSLSQPEIRDADIRQVGNDKEYTDIINGRRYRIVERTFAIIPNRSGNFVIKGPYFEGEVIDSGRQSFGFFNKTKTVSRVAKNMDISILPMPENYNFHWLPSEFVDLNEEWQLGEEELKVGTPITRTITLTAVGVVEEQLPEVNSEYTDAFKSYPEQANTTTVQRNGTFVSQRTETVALIANAAGEFVVPEVKVPWFNVKTKTTEYATLPEKNLTIAAVQKSQFTPSPEVLTAPPEAASPGPTSAVTAATTSWWSLSSWILLLAWLTTLGAWWQTSRNTKNHKTNNAASDKPSDTWALLQKSLMHKQIQVKHVNQALEKWLREVTNSPQASLSALLRLIGETKIATLVDEMNQHAYGKNVKGDWSGKELLMALQQLHKRYRAEKLTKNAELAELY